MAERIRILYLAANPGSTNRLWLSREVRRIAELVRASRYRDSLDLITRWDVRPDDWQQALLEIRPHVLHFSGHGTEHGAIVLDSDSADNDPAYVDHRAIVELTRILRQPLRVVVLNACYSDTLATELTGHIDCAIGTHHGVGDRAAIEFAAGFYRGLGFGKSVRDAYELGCNAGALHGLERRHRLVVRDGVVAHALVLVGPADASTDPGDSVAMAAPGPGVPDTADDPGETADLELPEQWLTGAHLYAMVDELIARLAEQRRLGARAQSEGVTARIDELVSTIRRNYAPAEGSRIADAELIRVIGAGNFGTIWEAETLDTRERVAVKIFRLERLAEGQMLWRFQRSIRAMRLLGEKKRLDKRLDVRGHIVRFRSADASSLAFSMDFMPGGNLEHMAQQGWTMERKVGVMVSVCSAVQYAHDNGVIHRDIKPANIVLDGERQPVLTDFDIADIKWATSLSTTVEGGLGTPVFAAPEQLVDAELANERSDVYSLGRLLYYMLLERSPGYEIEKDPSLTNLGDQPPALVEIVRKATQYDPRRRHSSVTEMMAELETCQSSGAAARARVSRMWRWVRVNRAMLVIVALIVGGSVGITWNQIRVAEQEKTLREKEQEARESAEAQRQRAEQEKERARKAEARATRASAELKRLGEQLAEMRKQKSRYDQEINRIEGEIARLKKQRDGASASVRARIGRVIAGKREELKELEARQVALRKKLERYEAEQQKTWRELERLEKEQELEKERREISNRQVEVGIDQEMEAEPGPESVSPVSEEVGPDDLVVVEMPDTGGMRVTANVEGADVYINGELRGKTPFQMKLADLKPGEPITVVVLSGERWWSTRIDEPRDLEAELRAYQFTGRSLGVVHTALQNEAPMRFIGLTGGEFTMGSPPDEEGRDADETLHRVKVAPFEIAEHEVTQKQWDIVMGENPGVPQGQRPIALGANPSNCDFGCGDDRPVQNISWEDAIEFLDRLSRRRGMTPCYEQLSDGVIWNRRCDGYRLPTEAEWEYACRAGKQTAYGFGDDAGRLGEYAWFGKNAGRKVQPVGGKKPSAWQLYDMHGNVREWVWDEYGPYRTGEVRRESPSAVGVQGLPRSVRGGDIGVGTRALRCANRFRSWSGARLEGFGLRVVWGRQP